MTEKEPYDMSIHTNPDAVAWAKFYTETRDEFYRKNPLGQFDSEDNMVGWFANAMMAMHDHIKGGPVVLPDGSAFFVADVPEDTEDRARATAALAEFNRDGGISLDELKTTINS